MKSLRALSIAASVVLAASFGFPDDLVKKGKGSSSDQGNRPRQDSRPNNGPRNDPPPGRRDEGQRPPRNDSPPSKPRDEGQRPPPRNDAPPTKPRDDGQRPPPRNDPPPTRPRDEGQRPPRNDPPPTRPRDEGQRPPRINDDLIKPRPGGGGGQTGPTIPDRKPFPGNDTRPKPREEVRPPRGGGIDDLLKPGGGDRGNGGQGSGIDRKPTPQVPIGAAPGRILDTPGGGDNLLRRKDRNVYGGQVNNQNRDGRGSRPAQIDRAPIDIFRGSLQNQVRREDRTRVSWRSGYHHYYRNWCDDYFWFGWYVFDPFVTTNCFVSPWYYYPHLPGYISNRCVRVITINLSPWYGTYYNWHRPYINTYDSYDYSPLDYALDDITRSFERADYRALRRLIPYNDRVAIFIDGEYTYSMEPDDFENFMYDAIEGTRTLRYEITRVERRGREAQIEARHEYEDPWGRRTTVYHSYRLEQDRGNFVITRFGTSFYRNW